MKEGCHLEGRYPLERVEMRDLTLPKLVITARQQISLSLFPGWLSNPCKTCCSDSTLVLVELDELECKSSDPCGTWPKCFLERVMIFAPFLKEANELAVIHFTDGKAHLLPWCQL